MINGGETADRMVDYTLKIGDSMLRLSGTAAKNLVAYLHALSKDNKKTRGKTRLIRMLKEGKELKVFQLDKNDMTRFAQEAKRYGILFTALRDRNNPSEPVDLLVKAEDASKVNRVLERLNHARVETDSMTAEPTETAAAPNPTRGRPVRPSVPSSQNKGKEGFQTEAGTSDKPSVRKRLQNIREQLNMQRKAAARHKIKAPMIHTKGR